MTAWVFLIAVYAAFALVVLIMGAKTLLRNVEARAARSAEHRGWMSGHETGADLHRRTEIMAMRARRFNR